MSIEAAIARQKQQKAAMYQFPKVEKKRRDYKKELRTAREDALKEAFDILRSQLCQIHKDDRKGYQLALSRLVNLRENPEHFGVEK